MELASNFAKCYGNPLSDIVHQVDQSRCKLEDKTRQICLPVANAVLFCGREGLALRGYDESTSILTQRDNNDGNFRALQRFRIDIVLEIHLNTCGKNAQYTSASVENELIAVGGKLITGEIAARVNAARFLLSG